MTDTVYKFEIQGKPQVQKNNKQIIWTKDKRTGQQRPCIVDNAKVARWRKSAVQQLTVQWSGRLPIVGNLAAVLTAYIGKAQRPDVDNLAAGPLDALEKAKIVANDYQFTCVTVLRRRDYDNPRVEILICKDDRLNVEIVGA